MQTYTHIPTHQYDDYAHVCTNWTTHTTTHTHTHTHTRTHTHTHTHTHSRRTYTASKHARSKHNKTTATHTHTLHQRDKTEQTTHVITARKPYKIMCSDQRVLPTSPSTHAGYDLDDLATNVSHRAQAKLRSTNKITSPSVSHRNVKQKHCIDQRVLPTTPSPHVQQIWNPTNNS
jgi:hypothetical protein